MNLKDLPFPVYGDTSFRDKCPPESVEQVTFFGWIRREYPETWGLIALHPRNEQSLKGGQHQRMILQKAEGLTKGASDIVIPGAPAFICELKRQDHTKSKWQPGQIEYLTAAQNAGCFVCVALGAVSASKAFGDYLAGLKGQVRS